MMLIDVLDMYAIEHGSNDLFLMLLDYRLDSRLNRDSMNRIIIKELGNHRPYTNNSTVLKFAIEEFFMKYEYNIKKLIDTMYYDYNPLTNKDIKEVTDEQEKRDSTGDIDNTDKYTTGQTEDSTGENKISAYDSSSYQPKDYNTSTAKRSTDHSAETTSDIKSHVDTDKDKVVTTSGKDSDTSYQTLIKQERKLAEFNIFNWIINQMRRELFLLVY